MNKNEIPFFKGSQLDRNARVRESKEEQQQVLLATPKPLD